jgi:RES domain-containing protein
MMNLGACSSLQTGPERSVWYRAIEPQHLTSALGAAQTIFVPTRFSPATDAAPAFPILYLAENHLAALLEVGAIFTTAGSAGIFFPNPQRAWTILNVQVTLQHVADLSDVAEQLKIGTSAQELTGDWRGYLERSAGTPVSGPTGPAPTQDLGQALYNLPGLEGFRTISSRMPTHRTLIVFPNKLRQGSRIVFTHPATRQTHTIP